jgi:hypothetical protein
MKTRRQILQGAATAATFPILGAQHSHNGSPASARARKPRVLTVAELDKLARLVDLIIPRSDTPGASDARVHYYIDRSLHLRKEAAEFRKGRQALDRLATERHMAPFADLDNQHQNELLAYASQHLNTDAGRFFEWVKNLTIDGYYSSKEGLVQELGWKGNTYLPEFKGCTHPEHQG